MLTRRHLVRSAASIAIAAPALKLLAACGGDGGGGSAGSPAGDVLRTLRVSGLALVPDPMGLLDLAPGLSYAALSRTGDPMSDGLLVPGAHDGMAAFPVAGDSTRCLIVRNHELGVSDDAYATSAFAAGGVIDPALVYDRTPAGRPHAGGTTTLLFNLASRQVERSHLSLAGTSVNCCGGPTPWGSWLTCEETQLVAGPSAQKSHGFIFEVPSGGTTPVQPTPLTAMGRFSHEAAAVDPATGVVYLTEDQGDGLIYRFLPDVRGELARGGRLQALGLVAQSGADTRNWPAGSGGDPAQVYTMGRRHAVRWIDLDAVDAPDGDLRQRGRAKGASIFARGEGMAFALEAQGAAIYFACTSGGAPQKGQVWRYAPSPYEGTSREADAPGQLELFVESRAESDFEMVDNIVASPLGDLVICEDGPGDNFVRAIAPDGLIWPIARNAHPGKSEFCGACFSPNGTTLFVNVQRPGVTYAITGDWSALRTAARAAV